MLASAGGWLWVADSGGRQVEPINVHEPIVWTAADADESAPGQRAAVSVSDPVLSLAAVPGAVFALTRTPAGGTQLSQIISRAGTETVPGTSSRAPRAPDRDLPPTAGSCARWCAVRSCT